MDNQDKNQDINHTPKPSSNISEALSKEIKLSDVQDVIGKVRKRIHDTGFINSFLLKLIAIIIMTIDHVGACIGTTYVDGRTYLSGLMTPDTYTQLRTIGRVAFPIFCFMIVEGYFHTRDAKKYSLRLLVFAFISQVPFNLMLTKAPFTKGASLNVYFTLFIGLVTIMCFEYCLKLYRNEERKRPVYIAIGIAIILSTISLADFLYTDYAGLGVIIILIFYFFRDKPLLIFAGLNISIYYLSNSLEMYALWCMVPILLYNHKKGPSMKYVFYIYYPLHMTVLYFIYMAML